MQAEHTHAVHDASNIALRKAHTSHIGLGSLVLGRYRWFRMLRISSGKHAQLMLSHSHLDLAGKISKVRNTGVVPFCRNLLKQVDSFRYSRNMHVNDLQEGRDPQDGYTNVEQNALACVSRRLQY